MKRQFTLAPRHGLGVALSLLILASANLFGQAIKVNFYTGSLNDVIAKARDEGKLIFVDVYSDYCPPCKEMDTKVFTNIEVATFYNRNFVNYKVNLSDRQNEYFRSLHDIKELPTLMYLSSEGKVLERSSGCKQVDELLQSAVKALNNMEVILPVANDVEYNKYMAYKQMYENAYNKTTIQPKILREYAYMLKKYHMPIDKVVNEYMQTQQKIVRSEENRQFIFDFSNTIENSVVEYLIKDLKYFKEHYGGERINEKIKTAIYNSVLVASQYRNESLFKKAERIAQDAKLPDETKYLFEIRSQYFQSNSDWVNYAKYAQLYLSIRKVSDPVILNDIARNFHLYVNNKRQLKEAVKWSKQAVSIEPEYEHYLTLGKLYDKLHNYKKAKQAFFEAIKIGRIRNIDYSEANNIISNIDNIRNSKY